ncbi:putative AAA+ superfamily ATPase [Algoriphagus sp. 4150]|uniref:ATP-binding protein n=1 Tax=Algoriphagus sp. 4150 TaxID=2817756 RepID=UPI002860C5D8|nr:AAA family ATPase [Algoriphagus sp. 4150]MDR7130129.1 putative AAA+ superfamily ATPase [Algoriphagus sp. 4150]
MERILEISKRKQQTSLPKFKRYLAAAIDWSQRLILILGHRGAGKTTLMLQKMQEIGDQVIYLSLDDFLFEEKRLAELIDQLYEKGIRYFFLDEVHRYPHWSADLKTLHDNYPDAYFVVSGSSILELGKGKADLSRRAAVYHLAGLSFREFISLEQNVSLPQRTLTELLTQQASISEEISDQLDILTLFDNYLKFGYYPFYKDGQALYKSRLLETTNLVLEMDIAPFEDLAHKTIRNMKKLIFIISESVPFIPNISKLAERLEVSRNTVLKTFDLLAQAQILNLLRSDTHGVSFLQKPEKIYLQNTNLAFALSSNEANRGNIRETFFLNQLQVTHAVTLPKYGDFMIDNQIVVEVGGPNKTSEQLRGIPNSFIAADGIKTGSGNKIPLWLFGFLY